MSLERHHHRPDHVQIDMHDDYIIFLHLHIIIGLPAMQHTHLTVVRYAWSPLPYQLISTRQKLGW
jgi:hypothetical protein